MRIANSAPPNKYGAYPFSIDSVNSIRDIDIYADNYSNDILTKACRPLCGQTQAFWSADKRNGGGAVENRTA